MRIKSSIIAILSLALLSVSCNRVPEDLQQVELLLRSTPAEARTLLDASASKESEKSYERALWQLFDVWTRYNSYEAELPVDELNEACDYFLSRRNHLRRAQAYYVRASVYEDQKIGGDSMMMDDLQRGCHEVEKTKDHNLAALLWQHYGAELNGRKWHTEAIAALEKSCFHAEKAGMVSHLVSSTINIAHSYLFEGDETGDYSKAIEYADKACEIAKGMSGGDFYSRALSCQASCFSRAGRFEEALEASREAVRLQEEAYASGKRKERVRYTALADAWRKVGNADSCIFYALKEYESPSLSSRINATQLLYCAYRDLLHDDAMTAKYMTENDQLTTELERQRENSKVVAGQIAFEKELSDQKQANILLTVCLAMLLVFVAFAFVIRVYVLRMRKADAALLQAEEEARRVAEKAEVATQEAERVTAVLVDKDDFIEALRDKPRYLSEFEWSRLEKTVDRIYDGWCRDLRENGVSDGGIRTAICVKLRFSNPDSATLLGISPSSFVKAKQRLKGRLSE